MSVFRSCRTDSEEWSILALRVNLFGSCCLFLVPILRGIRDRVSQLNSQKYMDQAVVVSQVRLRHKKTAPIGAVFEVQVNPANHVEP